MKKKNKAEYDKPSTIIGKETTLEAAVLKSESSLQINGTFLGDMEVNGSVVIGETGTVVGNIKSTFILVAGKVEGNLNIENQIHLTNTAKILGDIISGSIVIDEGACLDGNCRMSNGVDKKNKKEKTQTEKAS